MEVTGANSGGDDDGWNKKVGAADPHGDEENLSTDDEESQGEDIDQADGNQRKRGSISDGDYSNLERLRKQKRLAMNRASARNRRKQKRQMLDTLGSQVDDLGRINQGLIDTNTTLTNRIKELEREVSDARNTINTLLAATSAAPTQPASNQNNLVATLATLLPALTAPVPSSSSSLLSTPAAPDLLSQLNSLVTGGELLPAPGSAPPAQQPTLAKPNSQRAQPQQTAPPTASVPLSPATAAAPLSAAATSNLEAQLTQLLSTLDHQTLQSLWVTTTSAPRSQTQAPPAAPRTSLSSASGGQSQVQNFGCGTTGVNPIPAGIMSLLAPAAGRGGLAHSNQGGHIISGNNQRIPKTGGGQKRPSVDP